MYYWYIYVHACLVVAAPAPKMDTQPEEPKQTLQEVTSITLTTKHLPQATVDDNDNYVTSQTVKDDTNITTEISEQAKNNEAINKDEHVSLVEESNRCYSESEPEKSETQEAKIDKDIAYPNDFKDSTASKPAIEVLSDSKDMSEMSDEQEESQAEVREEFEIPAKLPAADTEHDVEKQKNNIPAKLPNFEVHSEQKNKKQNQEINSDLKFNLPQSEEIVVDKPPMMKKVAKDRNENNNEILVTVSVQENDVKPPAELKPAIADGAIVQKGKVTSFPDKFVPSIGEDRKQAVKSQASKIMLVRQGSFKNTSSEKKEYPLRKSGSLQSMRSSKEDLQDVKVRDLKKDEEWKKYKGDSVRVSTDQLKYELDHEREIIRDTPKDTKKKDTTDNLDLVEKKVSKSQIILKPAISSKDIDQNNDTTTKTPPESTLSSLCLETEKDVKPTAISKVRNSEIRRTQSVRTSGSEKPEWLQMKLRRVGAGQSTGATAGKLGTGLGSQTSVTSASSVISKSEPSKDSVSSVSVHRDITVSRSQSSRVSDQNTPSALKDTTNSKVYNPSKDSVKLTPVSERAKMFQMKESDPSGKQSPIDIISKAINLSRAESMRAPAPQRTVGVQRSESFKTTTPAATSDSGDVTLELTPQQSQVSCLSC